MGIVTGDMPDVDFILAVQKAENHKCCFGRGRACKKIEHCRWAAQCLALDRFAERHIPLETQKQQEHHRVFRDSKDTN